MADKFQFTLPEVIKLIKKDREGRKKEPEPEKCIADHWHDIMGKYEAEAFEKHWPKYRQVFKY